MSFLLSNRALLRGILAGAVVLAGTACSRSDRTQSAPDNSAAVLPDTTSAQPSGGDTATGAAQPSASAQSNSPRTETAPAGDKDVAGYRPMERDTTNVPSQQTDTAAIDASAEAADTTSTEMAGATDTAARVEVNVDTTAMGADTAAVEMARDTSTGVDQADTAATPSGDVALQTTVDTSSQDSAEVSAETEVAVVADSAGTVETEVAVVGAGAPDSTEVVRIRPPEDSTELLGDVTADEAADETADEQIVRPEDRETVAASEAPADEVGAAAVSGDVTGADAVAVMTREGVRCSLVDPETNEAVRWDMSSTPVTLNPCGMGSMVLSRIWTRVE